MVITATVVIISFLITVTKIPKTATDGEKDRFLGCLAWCSRANLPGVRRVYGEEGHVSMKQKQDMLPAPLPHSFYLAMSLQDGTVQIQEVSF